MAIGFVKFCLVNRFIFLLHRSVVAGGVVYRVMVEPVGVLYLHFVLPIMPSPAGRARTLSRWSLGSRPVWAENLYSPHVFAVYGIFVRVCMGYGVRVVVVSLVGTIF